MKKCFFQLCYVIGAFYLFYHTGCFATNSEEYPWYFKPNKVQECWLTTRGKDVLVDVLDSEVKFVSILQGKEHISIRSYSDAGYPMSDKEELHGTAVAGLIAGDRDELDCEDYFKPLCVNGKKMLAGIAPQVKIISRDITNGGFLAAILDALHIKEMKTIPEDAKGNTIWVKDHVVKLILLNISATRKPKSKDVIDFWSSKIEEKLKDNSNALLIVAVGNDAHKLTKENGSLPSILSSSAIIRVGGTAVYDYDFKKQPERYIGWRTGSNYGKDFVDIMAPGQSIPILTPSSKVAIRDGTSLATAIVSGAVALLASCNPNASAARIKQVLLEQSDINNTKLNEEVNGGRVLNIYNAVEVYCNKDQFIESDDDKNSKRDEL